MCQENGHLAGAIVGAIRDVIKLDPQVGEICLGHFPPRINVAGEEAVFFAVASTASFLSQRGGIPISEDLFDRHFTPQVAAEFLVEMAISLVEKTGILRKPSKTDLGKARVYFFFLSAVLSLFLDCLVSRIGYEKAFWEKIRWAEKHASEVALLEQAKMAEGGLPN